MAGLILLVLAAGLTVLRIRTSWVVTTAMLALELVSIGIVSFLGFAHAQDPIGRLIVPKAFIPSGATAPITWSVLLLGLTLAFFNMTGFNVSVLFSEETEKARKRVGRAVMLAVGVFVFVVIVPTAAALMGAPSLRGLSTSPSAMVYITKALGGERLGTFITLAIVVAIFNALVANIMGFGRVLWSGARDQVLPQPVNGWLEAVHRRFLTPWVACLVMAAAGAASLFSAAITGLVTLMGVITLVFMGLMCVSAIRIRFMPDAPRRYLMPLWPFVPIAVLASFVLMATGQTAKDLVIVLATAAGAAVYYLAYLRPRSQTKWVMLGAVEEPEEWTSAPAPGGGARDRAATGVAAPGSRRAGNRCRSRRCRAPGSARSQRASRRSGALHPFLRPGRAAAATRTGWSGDTGGRARAVRPPSVAVRRHARSHETDRGRWPLARGGQSERKPVAARRGPLPGHHPRHPGRVVAPGSAPPDGSYALIRCSADEIELVADIAASRAVWYYHDDDVFLASSSQRALVALLGDFELEPAA